MTQHFYQARCVCTAAWSLLYSASVSLCECDTRSKPAVRSSLQSNCYALSRSFRDSSDRQQQTYLSHPEKGTFNNLINLNSQNTGFAHLSLAQSACFSYFFTFVLLRVSSDLPKSDNDNKYICFTTAL